MGNSSRLYLVPSLPFRMSHDSLDLSHGKYVYLLCSGSRPKSIGSNFFSYHGATMVNFFSQKFESNRVILDENDDILRSDEKLIRFIPVIWPF